MSLMFWRRKNAKLASRLTNLVDAAERAKKTRRRQAPRVTIDTTYLDQDEDTGGVVVATEMASGALDVGGREARGAGPDTAHAVDEVARHDAPDGDGYVQSDDDEVAQADVLREAIAQLDEAEAREEELRVTQEMMRREADAQRQQLAELEALVERERAARTTAEAENAAIIARAAETVALASPTEPAGSDSTERAKRDLAEAQAREATARQTAEAQRVLVGALQSDIVREQAERTAAIAARDAAETALSEARATVRETTTRVHELEAAIGDETAGRARVEAAMAETAEAHRTAVDTAQSQIGTLDQELARERALRTEAEERFASAEARAREGGERITTLESDLALEVETRTTLAAEHLEGVEARSKLDADLASAVADLAAARQGAAAIEQELASAKAANADQEKAGEEARQQCAEAITRAEAAEADAAAQRRRLEELEADMASEQAARAAAEAEYAAAAQTADQLAKKLVSLEASLERSADAVMSATEFQSRIEAAEQDADVQRQRVTQLEGVLHSERAAFADVKAQREGAAKRAADTQKELEALRHSIEAQTDAVDHAAAEADAVEAGASGATADAAVTAPMIERAAEPASADDAVAADPAPVIAVVAAEALGDGKAAQPKSGRASVRKKSLSAEAVATVAKAAPLAEAKREPEAQKPADDNPVRSRIAKAVSAKERAKDNRRAKRVSSQKLGSLWNEGMSAALSCTMLDRSSTGAKLEVLTDRYNDRINDLAVGDRFTLTTSYAQERTSIACEVMWVAGRRCGVRFVGQIVTEVSKPAKRAMPKKAEEKATATKAIASLFGTGGR